MADEKKIIEIKVELTEGIKEIGRLVGMIDTLNKAQKDNQRTTEEQRTEYAANSVALKEYRAQLSTMVRETRNEIKTTNEKLGYIQQLKAQVSNLTLEYERLSQAELQGSKGGEVLTLLKNKREELSKLEQAYGNYSRNVGNYSSATNQLALNLGMVMKEIPNFAISARIGIMSLTNNLPMLAEAIKAVRVEQAQLAAEGKKTQSMISLLGKSIFGLTGIVSIGSALLFAYSDDLIRMFTNTTKADEAQQKLNKSLSEGNSIYNTTASTINEIETQLKLANKGFLDAEPILKEYNSKLGDTFGVAKNVGEALVSIINYKSQYVSAMVEMAAAQNIFEEATRKASEALAMERAGKPSFWANLKTVGNTIYESFDITKWGVMSLPQTLEKLSNTSKITYQNYLNDINNLRKSSFQDVKSYEKEVQKLAEKYKNEPFFAALFGVESKPEKQQKYNYKDTPAWKQFEAQYDAYKQMQEMLNYLQNAQSSINADLLIKTESDIDRFLNSISEKRKQAVLLSKSLADQLKQQADEDSVRWDEEQRRRIEKGLFNAQLELDTAEAKGQSTLNQQMALLDAQRKAELNNVHLTNDERQRIEEYYAAKREEIKREELKTQFQATGEMLGAIAGLFEENTSEYKMFATAQALMNTYLGITNALAQTKGGIVAQVAGAATAAAAGFAAVKKIWEVKTDGNKTSGTGASPAKLPPDTTSKMAQPISGYVSTSGVNGGSAAITSGAATSIATGGSDILRALANMPQPVVTVKDIEIATNRVKVVDKLNRV